MDIDQVKKYIGKRVLIVLNNNFEYTTTIPEFHGTGFEIKDKFNETADIQCSFIAFIKEKPLK